MPSGARAFTWLSRTTLWAARNDWRARLLGDASRRRRERWVDQQRTHGSPTDLVIDRTDLSTPAILLLGDTGEGDASQYAVVPPMLAAAGDTDLAVICSDVIYPAGAATDYEERFFRPYRDYPSPIFAVPGNHDWYDGLEGFMLFFCDARPPGASRRPQLDPAAVTRARKLRDRPAQQALQPGPYWAIETGPLILVGIDAGIRGPLDRAQGGWLRRIATASPKPKVLLSGRPLYADARHDPIPISGGGTVDDIVREASHRFVATVAGDVHNYQRYPVALPDGRTIHHVVNGGGGAYTNATHPIPRVDLPGVGEEDIRLYPLRGDSLSFYSGRYDAWSSGARGRRGDPRPTAPGALSVDPDEAAAIMARRLDLLPVRPSARRTSISESGRRAEQTVFPAGGYRGWNRFFSQYFDSDEPPFFKSFVRLDVSDGELRLRCFAATGCAEHEADPPLEDEVAIPLP